ncbi:DUF3560 domain-containing protein [Mycolicibacterium senegalense]|uniref:DUF3560 domain-containing protein n=1 Tax=Mycolicibacterium senegalense TaxID=1796 RepID=UPI003AADA41B
MTLTISHSHKAGTLIAGTRRGDGTAEVLKAIVNPCTGRARAWRWSRNVGSWYVQRSRDADANTELIEATETALEAAGFTVAVNIDDSRRSTAEVEADKVARQAVRVDALDDAARRKEAVAEAADARARELSERMPLGQPILVDHYSAPRMRKAYDEIEKAARTSLSAYQEAKSAGAKAAAASTTSAHRYAPGVIRRRIERLEAQLRGHERTRDGHTRTLFVDGAGISHVDTVEAAQGEHRERVLAAISRVTDEIGYWRSELDKAAAGGAQLWDASTIEVGDKIRFMGDMWATVAKVNAKSVGLVGRSGRLPYDRIKDVQNGGGDVVRIVAGARVIGADQ